MRMGRLRSGVYILFISVGPKVLFFNLKIDADCLRIHFADTDAFVAC